MEHVHLKMTSMPELPCGFIQQTPYVIYSTSVIFLLVSHNICCILKMVFVCIFLDIINIYTALLIDAPAAQSHVFWPLCCLMSLCKHIKVLIFRALSWHSTSHDLPLQQHLQWRFIYFICNLFNYTSKLMPPCTQMDTQRCFKETYYTFSLFLFLCNVCMYVKNL